MIKYIPRICFIFFLVITCKVSYSQIDRIVLTWENDPATTQSVVWRTAQPADAPQAQWALLAKHSNDLVETAETVAAGTETIVTVDDETFYHHTARFSSLIPDTTYAYRVGDGETWSEWNSFRTAAAEPEPFRFIYLGDVQNGILSDFSILMRRAYAKAPDARFILIGGDLVNRGQNDNEWGEFFQGMGFIPRMIPIVAVPGNHDASRTIQRQDGSRAIDPLYLVHFALPLNGPPVEDLKETAFILDYQGVRIIGVNTNSYRDEDQLAWLKDSLSDDTGIWTITCHHHPLFSTGSDRNNRPLRERLMPIYQNAHVDLVLQGHDHRYGRTNKIIDGETVADDAQAPIYVVSVSGPKAYDHNPNFEHLMQVEKGETQCYQIISVTPSSLTYKGYSLNDQLIDAFELKKESGRTVLINK